MSYLPCNLHLALIEELQLIWLLWTSDLTSVGWEELSPDHIFRGLLCRSNEMTSVRHTGTNVGYWCFLSTGTDMLSGLSI